MSNKTPNIFTAFNDALQGNKRPTDYPVSHFQNITLDLSVAHRNARLEIQGDFIYVDPDSIGIAQIGFNNPQLTKIDAYPGFSLHGFPIKDVYITNIAQPGGLLSIWYGYGCLIALNNLYSQTNKSTEFHDTGINLSNTIRGSAVGIGFVANTPLQLTSPNPTGQLIYELQICHNVLDINSNFALQFGVSAPPDLFTDVLGLQDSKTLAFQAATTALSSYTIITRLKRPFRLGGGLTIYGTSTVTSIAGSGSYSIIFENL
jgi:hypothetical protein